MKTGLQQAPIGKTKQPASGIGALILAAGSARRFGSDKRLYRIDGTPMLARTLTVYRAVFDDVGVVVRPGEYAVAELVRDADCRIIEAADAAEGQSRSLAAGATAMLHCDGLVVGLADMPFVQAETLRALAAALAAHPQDIVRPRCQGRPGNPVGFPASAFAALTRIQGDRGARQAIAASDRVRWIDVDDRGVLEDIDQPPQSDTP